MTRALGLFDRFSFNTITDFVNPAAWIYYLRIAYIKYLRVLCIQIRWVTIIRNRHDVHVIVIKSRICQFITFRRKPHCVRIAEYFLYEETKWILLNVPLLLAQYKSSGEDGDEISEYPIKRAVRHRNLNVEKLWSNLSFLYAIVGIHPIQNYIVKREI